MQDYQAMLLKGAITLALLQGTWALTSPLKRLRRATTVTKGANVGLASLKPADLKIAGSAACGSYIQGYTTGVLGGALLFLGPHFGLTPAQIGAVATATTLGSVLGTFSASALADAAGRRPTMAFSSALFVVASVLMVWTPSLNVLVLARFLAGVGIGNCGAVVPVYVAECAEAASRGALATLPQLMISSGAMSGLVVTFAVALCRTGLDWSAATASRVSLGFTLLPSLLYAALVLRLPESPRYLLRKGRRERALAALGTLRGGPCEAELTALEQATAKETKGAARREAGWRTLLEPKILRRLGVCVVLQFFQQFAGINAIVYFTPHILKSSGTVATLGSSLRLSADSAALLATAVTYFPKIPAMFLTMALMDTWGRAKMLRVFSPAMGLCLAALGLSLGSSSGVAATVALLAIALYGIFFNLSLGPVPNIYTAESFPARARSAAMTVSLCAQFLAHAMVSFWFPVLMASRGAPAVLYSFAGICGVAGLFACTLAETKQASLEAIASELD